MATKSEMKRYASLKDRKARAESDLFIAEGRKIVTEGLRSGCPCENVFVRKGYLGGDEEMNRLLSGREMEVLDEQEFRKLSDTRNPQGILGIFDYRNLLVKDLAEDTIIALFDVADPRNMGTIIRSADWFGIREIVIGETCVDLFNDKVVRSTMGSIFHNRFHLASDLSSTLSALKPEYRIVTADIGGADYRKRRIGGKRVFVFSNEARGPSRDILEISDEIVTITGKGRAESLNVSCAAAIIMADIE